MNWINQIKNYIPTTLQESKDKDVILEYSHYFSNLLFRENNFAHVTSSAFVINKDKTKTLMIHHNIFNSWSFPGGHADGDGNLLDVAIKEVKEETGIQNPIAISNDIVSLDLLPVRGHMKKGSYVSPHIHISLTYLFYASEEEILTIKEDENSNVAWLNIKDLDGYTKKESHMQFVFKKIINKLNNYTLD